MTYRELVERQLAVRHADLELGLSRSREQEPFVIHVSNLLDKAGVEYTVRDLCKKVLPPTAETKTKIFSCFHPKSLLIRLKYPLNPPWIPD